MIRMDLQLRTYDIWILYMYITSACQGPGAHHILRKNLGGKACIDSSDICGVGTGTDLSVFFGGWRWGFRAATGKCGALSHVAGSLFRWHLGGNDRNAHWWKKPFKLQKKICMVACFDAINYQPSFQSSGSSQLPGLGAITGGVCTDWLQSRRCQLLTMRRGTTVGLWCWEGP